MLSNAHLTEIYWIKPFRVMALQTEAGPYFSDGGILYNNCLSFDIIYCIKSQSTKSALKL